MCVCVSVCGGGGCVCSVVSNPCNPMDCNQLVSSVHEIAQARILEWVAISFSKGSSQPRYQSCPSCIGRRILHHWVSRKLYTLAFSSVQSPSPVQLCNPMDCSMSGLPVNHQLPELAQTHVHQVGDAIQTSHPLSFGYVLISKLSYKNHVCVCICLHFSGSCLLLNFKKIFTYLYKTDLFPIV